MDLPIFGPQLDSICASVSEGNIPLLCSAVNDRCDSDTDIVENSDSDFGAVGQLAQDAGYALDDIKVKVGAIFDRNIQASLRDKSRNRDFHRIVGYQNSAGSECLACQSDDFVFLFNCRTGDVIKWFIIKHPTRLTQMEKEILDNIKHWLLVDRMKYPVCYGTAFARTWVLFRLLRSSFLARLAYV